ncbi:S41 family peptidase [Bdellovibrio sp. HCB337]|uniref:S41 family peptidase n=1 Tax=Bdellovibrio sp. HCB337 TaxID=3394358 RepID=UPI0039A44BB2
MDSSLFKKPGWIPGFLFFVLCLYLGMTVVRKHPPGNTYAKICTFVNDRIYMQGEKLVSWSRGCVKRSELVKEDTPVAAIVEDLNDQFSILHASHLSIYSPQESRRVWQGESKETGIESQYVDGELVIFKVHKNSPAERAGLRMGDVIYRINDDLGTPELAEKTSGKYLILRQKKITEYKISTGDIKREEDPQIIPLTAKTAVFKVPSFRAEYFEKEKWLSQVSELKKYQKIIVDLRGNLGGNFVAGLRFLSPFMCSPQDIGYLWKPKSKLKKEMTLPDDLNDENQIVVLDQSFLVRLWTFEDYDCLAASVAVLVDSGSASTSEMVAQALKDYIGAKIFGSASAGQLLVGVWYPVPELADGVKISVPEALYQTRRGHKIEGPGVQVDKVLYYHLSEMENGEDSWIKKAVQLF